MNAETFRKIAPTIPHQPGVYKYFDDRDHIIYVGKAKDLRKRVSSYFNKTYAGYKTHELVQRIVRIEFNVVDTEQDAFFLENALIKQYQPKYNIDLKDDKTYPYIVIKKEPFPRVFLTRRKINDGSEYLGPFTSVARVRELLLFIKQHIQLRTCKLPLTQKNITAKKFRVCLEYHLGNCKGPCVGFQTELEYREGLNRLKQVLKGKLDEVVQYYKEEMRRYAEQLEFEKAQITKKKLEHLEQYQVKSVVVSQQVNDVDVFSIYKADDIAYVNFLMVRSGTIVQTHTLQLTPHLDETEAEVLSFAIARIRESFDSDATEIIVPLALEYADARVQVTIPKLGDKKKLIELSQKNVLLFKDEVKRKKLLNIEEKTEDQLLDILEELQDALSLPELPLHIECFDNSNFQGSYPVSAMVCFKNGAPSKNDYRRFNVKTVQGINDFATMKEAVTRRYKRLSEEAAELPQLVIIDGGKGQLNAALEAIEELGLSGQITLVGLAKNIEELFFAGDQQSIKLNWNSEGLKLVRRIRDEVHRFGITFHRQKRSKGTFKNELEDIAGIGKQTATALLRHFRSVNKVKQADLPALEAVIGKQKAQLVLAHFAPK
ncbi:MAG: excinuclease ABC subunit UvrC [Bacteroidetes bacterium]|uniref:excinuclease ABC subunit UvrC n=1 Tax=Phnomibacter sp. TaxID=2836217 RepID=UPI002FDCC708|nr:excinuclease ABC subunit UvrC [Bacteroidota bacterium]